MATILLIEEDDDARPIIRHNLRRAGFDVLVAVDEASACD
jgi:DNA-binding response OmpR family regulator